MTGNDCRKLTDLVCGVGCEGPIKQAKAERDRESEQTETIGERTQSLHSPSPGRTLSIIKLDRPT
jgi:hypothetical protein